MKVLLLSSFVCCFFSSYSRAQQPCSAAHLLDELKAVQFREKQNLFLSEFQVACVTGPVQGKIISMLKGEWDKEELSQYVQQHFKRKYSKTYFEKEIRNMAGKDSSRYDRMYDSLLGRALDKEKAAMTNWKINEDVILLSGYLDMMEAKPLLYAALKVPGKYNTKAVKLALARMGDTAFQHEMISQSEVLSKDEWQLRRKMRVLCYINTQEAMYALAKELENSTSFVYRSESPVVTLPLSYLLLESLAGHMLQNKDFADHFKSRSFVDAMKFKKEDVLYAQKWMEEHKGKYILNRRMYL